MFAGAGVNIYQFRKQNEEECMDALQIDSVNQTDWRRHECVAASS